MKNIWIVILALIMVSSFLLISGCQKPDEKAAKTAAGYSDKANSGEALRQDIYKKTPYRKWALWPGKGELFEGTEPHGEFITVYVNDAALQSIKGSKGMANNSIVLKENYNTAKQLTSVTVMKKVKGFNPEGGDWFWARFDPEANLTHEGKVQMCQGCHDGAEENDYIFTGKVTTEGMPSSSAPGYGEQKETAPGYAAPGYDKLREIAPGYAAPGYGKLKGTAPGYGEKKAAPGYK